MKRVRVIVAGAVQGVFFRARTRNEAIRNSVRGWVRNLPDGRVEAVFEGQPEDVDRLVEWCRIGPSHAFVDHVEVTEEAYTGAFRDFSIRYGP
ncbi:MAG: Acylphosphatase [Syntrophaceae bacterium PtaB.Bin038]|jgi:acylphosphatase|nr:MAG: Acylphosphatase [Syntrophaceae bacterium PtaB.Bin038]